MLRIVVLFVTALVFCTSARAEAVWQKIKSFEIDQRVAGSTLIDLSENGSAFRSLRFQSSASVTIDSVTIKADLVVKAATGPFRVAPNKPSEAIFFSLFAVPLKTLQLRWSAVAAATGPVSVEIWATASQEKDATGEHKVKPVGADRETERAAKKSADDVETSRANSQEASGGDNNRGHPRTRGLSQPRPAPASAPPPVVGGAAPAAGNVCIEQSICTIVPVFFGTDRNQIPGGNRIAFGSDRTNKITLGQTIVTVPKVKRDRGVIERPWLERYLGVAVQGDPKLHFTIPKAGVTVYDIEADFLLNVKRHMAQAGTFKDHAFIYVHGFAVTFDYAMYRAAQIAYDLTGDEQPFGTAFVYSWPSKGSVLPTAYLADSDAALDSAENFRAFVKLVTEKTGAANVHIIAHSMGNRVLMRTLQNIQLSGGTAKINQVILAAPDVDRQEFENVAKGVGRLAKGITLYASKTDAALVMSRRIRGGISRAGDVFNPPGPAIVDGIDTVDISALSTAIFDYGHDTYANSSELLSDIATIFTKANSHPPTVRNAKFKLLQQGALQYWSYAR